MAVDYFQRVMVIGGGVVKAGEIEVIRASRRGDLLVAVHRSGQFTGEASIILGRPALMRVRVLKRLR